MKAKANQKDWMTIPILPCISIEETLDFWEMMGFEITYKQTRPYQYGVLKRNDYELHYGRVKGMDKTNNFSGCLVMVFSIEKVYDAFCKALKQNLGKIPHSGVPRISRMKPEATRFTLTDVSGNSILFVSYEDEDKDQEIWEKADDKNQSPLKKAIATAIRFRDYKEDIKASAATLDVALRKASGENSLDFAEALIIRMDLAVYMEDSGRADECRELLNKLDLKKEEIDRLIQKHFSE